MRSAIVISRFPREIRPAQANFRYMRVSNNRIEGHHKLPLISGHSTTHVAIGRVMRKLLIITLMTIINVACSGRVDTAEWTEETRLSNGQTVMLWAAAWRHFADRLRETAEPERLPCEPLAQ
jgi:hypothetical protein